MNLIILRHGETSWTLSGQHTGTTELDLTEHGRNQARAQAPVLLRMLRDRDPVRIYVSPRRRARETAASALAEPYEICDLIEEFHYGDYEGLTPAQVQERRPRWDIWSDGCPNGETMQEAGARADAFLDSFCDERCCGDTGAVVAVTHGHMSRVLVARALGLEPEHGRYLASSTASLSVVTRKNGRPALDLWNLTPELVATQR